MAGQHGMSERQQHDDSRMHARGRGSGGAGVAWRAVGFSRAHSSCSCWAALPLGLELRGMRWCGVVVWYGVGVVPRVLRATVAEGPTCVDRCCVDSVSAILFELVLERLVGCGESQNDVAGRGGGQWVQAGVRHLTFP